MVALHRFHNGVGEACIPFPWKKKAVYYHVSGCCSQEQKMKRDSKVRLDEGGVFKKVE